MSAVTIELTIPGMLAAATGLSRHLTVMAGTLASTLKRIKSDYPKLAAHVFDDAGNVRRHVLIFLNGESIAWMDDHHFPLKPGDRLDIVQAVSGG